MSRLTTPIHSAKSRRTPSAKRANSAASAYGKPSLLFPGQSAHQLDTLANFRQLIAQRIDEELSRLLWIKVVLLGPTYSGKTSLIRLFCENKYQVAYQPTVGVDYGFKIHTCRTEQSGTIDVRVNFWDTAGPEEFLQVRNELYADMDVCILVGDVSTNPAVQESILEMYRDEADKYCRKSKRGAGNKADIKETDETLDPDIEAEQEAELKRINQRRRPFLLAVCANKTDLLKIGRNNDDPSLRAIAQFASNQNLKFYQVSCITPIQKSVENMFTELIEMAVNKKLRESQSSEMPTTGILKIIENA